MVVFLEYEGIGIVEQIGSSVKKISKLAIKQLFLRVSRCGTCENCANSYNSHCRNDGTDHGYMIDGTLC
jgi:D-arabinose 1-dehydrogenase-like Zn-dependent alcohol dehydrogenase